jgi:ASC-1-like (ASCH) protein
MRALSRRELFHVIMLENRTAKACERRVNSQQIASVKPGDTI